MALKALNTPQQFLVGRVVRDEVAHVDVGRGRWPAAVSASRPPLAMLTFYRGVYLEDLSRR